MNDASGPQALLARNVTLGDQYKNETSPPVTSTRQHGGQG